jgi:tetratricopeptide (TPR) repeat protein
LFGWNIETAFRWPLLARNMKELWVRWNVYYRQALVNLFFYPFIRQLGNPLKPARHVAALIGACLLTFVLSAALHMILYGWQPALATGYFVLQSIPVCYVLVREYLRMQRARRLRQRPADPDPLFTPLFIAITFLYQSLLHYCMADEMGGTVSQRFIALVSLPVQLLYPLLTIVGGTALSVAIGVGVVRAKSRNASPPGVVAKGRLVGVALIAGLIGLVTAAPVASLGQSAVDWAKRQPIGAAWEMNAGIGLARAGRFEEAVERLNLAMAFDPQSIRTQEQLIEVHLAKNDTARAAETANQLISIDPINVSALNALAQAALTSGQFDAAIEHLRTVYVHNPRSFAAARNLTRILAGRGRVDEAVQCWNQAAVAVPESPEPRRELAELLIATRRYDRAIEVLQSAANSFADDARINAQLAMLLAASPDDNLRDGAQAMSIAIRLTDGGRGGSPFALIALAAAHAELGQFDEAVAVAKRARSAALQNGDVATSRQIEGQLAQYAAHQPLRFPR